MKSILLLLFLCSTSLFLGQSSDAFTHRAVIMNNKGEPRALENFEAEVKLLKNPKALNEVSYGETHSIKTDSLGWYSIKIGSGKVMTVNNGLSDIDWSAGNMYLNIKVMDTLGSVVSQGITEILSSPKISFARNIESKALLTLDCLTNLEALRNFPVPADGEMICVKGHTSVRDGGEGFFFYKSEMLEDDDDGIIIRPKEVYSDKPGRWVRHIDGYINVNYFGITSGQKSGATSNSKKIQKVIDFAARKKATDYRSKKGAEILKGNTVFFPGGEYLIDGTVVLKSGVALLGEENTLLTAQKNANFDYFFKMEPGRVVISMENLRLNGNNVGSVGGMFLQARDGEDGTGGLWQSRFKNINIVNIQGHGIHLEGGDSAGINGLPDYSLPNQMTVFENVRVTRLNDEKNSLRMTQYQGQFTFINCLFLGKRDRSSLGTNVLISNPGGNVITFLNCTIQESVYGFRMEKASNITFDNCWFENLYFAIDVTGGRSINILNNRFANASGYGSEGFTGPANLPENIGDGSCITSENSSVNVERNYVLVTDPDSPEAQRGKFIVGRKSADTSINTNTINSRANTFADGRLSKTVGIVQSIPVSGRTININGRNNVAAEFGNTTVLRTILSSLSGGEQVTLKIHKFNGSGNVKIKDWEGNRRKGNIFLNGPAQLKLSDGQYATFLKVDAPLSNNGEEPIYQLISVSK